MDELQVVLGEIKTQLALNGLSVETLQKSFDSHEDKLDELDKKVDDLRVSVAKRNGALEENRRHARNQGGLAGLAVSLVIACISAFALIVSSGACS